MVQELVVTNSGVEHMEAELLLGVWEGFLDELMLSCVLKGRPDVGMVSSQAIMKCLPK